MIILTRKQLKKIINLAIEESILRYDVKVLEHSSKRHDGEIKALAENAGVVFRNGYRTEPKVKS